MVPRGLTAHPLSLSATGIPRHPTLSPIYRPSRLTRLWAQGLGVGVEGCGAGGTFPGSGTAVPWLAAQLATAQDPKVGE